MPAEHPIPLAAPWTGDDELAEVGAVLASGYLSQGPKVAEFEQLVAKLVGSRHAVATSSCTTAMHLALVALDIGLGDEILVPDFTFPATANVVVQQGAVPVLVDVQPGTYNVEPAALAAHLTERTRAIMPVHLFGLSADLDPCLAFARNHGLAVIEDAACALGSTYRSRPCGSLGDVGCYSFHPRKVITTGEGGMVVTDDDDLAARLRLFRSHGGVRAGGRFTFHEAGFNYRLSDVHAALGVAQMRRLPDILARRRALADRLSKRLAAVGGVTPPSEPAWAGHVFQAYVTCLDEGVDRDAVVAGLAAHGIETTIGTYALHAQPFFGRTYGYRPGDLPWSYAASHQTLALPLYPQMTEDQADLVADALETVLASVLPT
jgi:dTDP-4-amino-4,6-dideoxygalactose transaminase